ncbi:MAG TPA: RHS repeat-associated core domain-containing protein, partial [Polyangiaceae bacterium]|nr:RHS repeat-associated core domain-containing protein [Polyangiaceae bacterium]
STSYETARLSDGSELRTTTLPEGTVQTRLRRRDGSAASTSPERTLTSAVDRPDPRWGIAAPVTSRTERLPSGLERVTTSTRDVTLSDPRNLFSVSTLTDTTTVNGRVYRSVFDAATATYSLTSPAGRRSFRVVDSVGRTLRWQVDGLEAIDFLYDADGRLQQTLQGQRVTSYDYFEGGAASGYLQDITDALGDTTHTTRDALGRVLTVARAGTTTSYVWDGAGNLISLTPAGQPAHGMTYTPVDLLASYDPPSSDGTASSTAYAYDADRARTSELRPSGAELLFAYDAAGRLVRETAPSGVIERQYHAAGSNGPGQAPGRLAQLSGPGNVSLAYGYDGELPTTEALSGDVSALVRWDYDANRSLVRQTVTAPGVNRATAFAYDADLLLTCASPSSCAPLGASALSLTRDPQHGLVTRLNQGTLSEARSYDGTGELRSQTLRAGITDLLGFEYAGLAGPRDGLGRILQQLETQADTTRELEFAYDVWGRLIDVSVNAELSEHYEYDANGNRLLGQTPAGTAFGTYDVQDRLLSYGDDTYEYSADGDLLAKTSTLSGDVTAYDYDAFGNLLGVELPDGRNLQYVVDGRGRRIGKKVDGVLTRQWIYGSQLQPIAELDGAGNLISSFAYASRSSVPDYLQRANGAVYRIVSDQVGSVRLVVNISDSSDVLWRADYSAFGELTLLAGNADVIPFGFAGGLYDPDTELVRFGARDYDPALGRWTSKDPVLWRGQETNRYAYEGNDPVNLTADTSGR